MQVKTIKAPSLPEALKRAKELFGNEVILLESKKLNKAEMTNHNERIQVTVSVPDGNRTIHPWKPEKLKREEVEKNAPAGNDATKNNDFNKMITDILANKPQQLMEEKKILAELAELRKDLEQLTKSSQEQTLSAFPDAYQKVAGHLTDKGFNETIAQNLIKRVYQFLEKGPQADEKEIIAGVRSELAHSLQVYPLHRDEGDNQQKIILLLGASGVGKTSVAMKLAAHPDIYGKKDVIIISTDLYGPSEALKAFSRMTGTAIYEGKQTDEIEGVMQKFKDKEVIIFDTPGQSPFAPNYLAKLEEYIKIIKPTDIFLVLSMSSDLKDIFLACAVHLLLKPNGIIFTKFDETTQPGKVFNILAELEIPAVCFSEGKRVFMDFEPANVDYLFDKIFETA